MRENRPRTLTMNSASYHSCSPSHGPRSDRHYSPATEDIEMSNRSSSHHVPIPTDNKETEVKTVAKYANEGEAGNHDLVAPKLYTNSSICPNVQAVSKHCKQSEKHCSNRYGDSVNLQSNSNNQRVETSNTVTTESESDNHATEGETAVQQ